MGAARQQLQQPQGNRSDLDPQQQHQQQATACSNDALQRTGAAVDSTLQMRPAHSRCGQHNPSCPDSSRDDKTTEEAHQQQQQHVPHQSNSQDEKLGRAKKESVASPGNDLTSALPGGIPQVDGADRVNSTPDGVLTPPYRVPPTPPPMCQYCPSDPYRVLCHLCLKNAHYLL